MGLADLFWLLGIVALTTWLLLRNFRSRRAGCGGCAAGCGVSACPGGVKKR